MAMNGYFTFYRTEVLLSDVVWCHIQGNPLFFFLTSMCVCVCVCVCGGVIPPLQGIQLAYSKLCWQRVTLIIICHDKKILLLTWFDGMKLVSWYLDKSFSHDYFVYSGNIPIFWSGWLEVQYTLHSSFFFLFFFFF